MFDFEHELWSVIIKMIVADDGEVDSDYKDVDDYYDYDVDVT